MNESKSKQIRTKAHDFMYEWLCSVVPAEETKLINKENYLTFFPTLEKYVYMHNKLTLSTFSERWFIQSIKKKLKNKKLNQIKLQDVL